VWRGPGSYFWPCWLGILVVWRGPDSYLSPFLLGIVAVWRGLPMSRGGKFYVETLLDYGDKITPLHTFNGFARSTTFNPPSPFQRPSADCSKRYADNCGNFLRRL
jgi:hypothetical protein